MMANIVQDLARKITLGSKDPSGDQVALYPGEPDLNLIEPGRVSGSVVDGKGGVGFKERGDAFGFVSR